MLAPRKTISPGTLLPPIVTARGGERGIAYRSEKAHVQYWTGQDIPVEFNADRLMSAYRLWTRAAQNDLPSLRELQTAENAAIDDHMLFLNVKGDFLVVSQGADHMRHINCDLRGRMLSEFNTPIVAVMTELHAQCLASRQAIYVRFVSDFAPEAIYWECLKLPLRAGPGNDAQMVMNYSIPVDHKTDIIQMVLDRAPVGVIAAVPLGPDHGDARIVSINARAKKMLKFDANGSRVHYIRDLAPWFRDIAWTRTGVTVGANKTCFRYRDPADHVYAVTMEPLKRFVLFTIVETPRTPTD